MPEEEGVLKKLAPHSPKEGPPLPSFLPKWPWRQKVEKAGEVEGIKLLAERELPTPFGKVALPALELPPLKPPKIDDRRRKALGHAVGVDASDLVALIPYVGGMAADSIRAMHTREIKKLLTPEEFDKYLKWDKQYPDLLAAVRTFIEGGT